MSDQDLVLNKVLLDIFTNPALEEERLEYAEAGAKRFVLKNGKGFGLSWPPGFKPSIPGYVCHMYEVSTDRGDAKAPPLLGVRLDKCDLAQEKIDPFYGNVSVSVSNVGGYKGKEDASVGGTSIYYLAKRTPTGWSVEWLSLRAP